MNNSNSSYTDKNETNSEYFSGVVERVTFHNSENGFCVLKIKTRKARDLITLVGNISNISPGEYITSNGIWINDRIHGMQFKANFLKTTMPTSEEGIEKYLGSGLIKGIGPVYAKKLVKSFGDKVFDIIEEAPHRLNEVEGIGRLRKEIIIKGWTEQKIIREIMLFLYDHKISTARAVRIYKTYGSASIKLILENPYRLAKDIKGIGFISADNIAKNIGIDPNSLIRAKAGLEHILLEATDEGHTGLPKNDLLQKTTAILGIPLSICEEALEEQLKERFLIADLLEIPAHSTKDNFLVQTTCIFLADLYNLEKFIATSIKSRFHDSSVPWEIDTSKAINWLEEKSSLKLAASQVEAVKLAINSKLLVITGGPGVGKTTIINNILKILITKKVKIMLCAPTGRAAKRLSETTKLEAKTIHRLLEINPSNGGFKFNQDNQLDCDLLVIDETSMIDISLMAAILKALPFGAALLLVGDVDQLPSVGPGNVLKDIINSNVVPTVKLTEIFRQAETSLIITNAHKINKSIMPDLTPKENSDFFFIEYKDPEDGMKKIKTLIAKRIAEKFGFDPIKDIQILCPMNRGYLGTSSLNLEIQKLLNPEGGNRIEKFGKSFANGDKVMQTQNDYDKEVYNGDIGYITAINPDSNTVTINFDDRNMEYDFGELDCIVHAYAITIHKSQGSEYPVVIIPLSMQHYKMLQKNLLYTAVTRGRKLVIIVGEKKALNICIKKQTATYRLNKLQGFLKN